jgi:hypothetical protein
VLTGYNTDVEYDGVTYHIQTEDKGLGNPIILSLVYVGGAILASRRAPYDDLVTRGFDERILGERLHRQHKLMCAAVHAGRLEDLKRLSETTAEKKARQTKAPYEELPVAPSETSESIGRGEVGRDAASITKDQFAILSSIEDDESLQVRLLEEKELRAGELVTLRVLVSRAAGAAREPVAKARVLLKTLGSNFRSESIFATTGQDGVALIHASLPRFTTGRAAILVRAEVDDKTVELRRVILPA